VHRVPSIAEDRTLCSGGRPVKDVNVPLSSPSLCSFLCISVLEHSRGDGERIACENEAWHEICRHSHAHRTLLPYTKHHLPLVFTHRLPIVWLERGIPHHAGTSLPQVINGRARLRFDPEAQATTDARRSHGGASSDVNRNRGASRRPAGRAQKQDLERVGTGNIRR